MVRISLNNLLLFVYFFCTFLFHFLSVFPVFANEKKCFIFCFDILHAICFCYRSSKIVVVNPVRCVRRDDIHPPHFYMFKICPFSQSFASISTAKVVRCRRNFSFFILIFLTKKKVQTNININVFGFFL